MKKMARCLLLAFLATWMMSGCATISALKAKSAKKKIRWWSNALGTRVVDVKEDYSDCEVPSTRVKTTSGIELIFH